MKRLDLTDTIAAISTGLGESGIGIVRLSGKEALSIAEKIFLSKNGRRPSGYKTFTTHYGWVVEDMTTKKIIDEVILTVMRAPKSYTKEDIVEINCHGGIVALRRILALVLENGCRLAQPGEFTKRAFMNGRIDLAQAEAVLDVIKAKTDAALRNSVEQLKGALSKELNAIRGILLELSSILEASIDFPEEEMGQTDTAQLKEELKKVEARLEKLLLGSRFGRIFREGIRVVICGRTNVGKSSLLNALLRQERSIVTPIAGTTRDTVEETINIRGVPVMIADTAGITKPDNLAERKAIERSRRYIEAAQLVLLVFDGSQRLRREDLGLMRRLKHKPVLAVLNKIDLIQRIEHKQIEKRFIRLVEVSAKKAKNISLLEDALVERVCRGDLLPQEPILVTNLRHLEDIKEMQKLIAEAINSLDNNTALPLEFIAQDIKDALRYLDDILGLNCSEDLLDRIFSAFCIGK